MDDIDLNELRKSHLSNLRRLLSSLTNSERLHEHIDIIHNSIESHAVTQAEKEKSRTFRVNQNLLIENERKSKRFEIDWNLDYCNTCRLSYWPRNCQVKIIPKFGISQTSARLFSRYKLKGFTPKYKSFKEKLVKNLLKRSFRYIYKCKRCRARNVIVKELNRPEPRLIQLGGRPKREIKLADMKNNKSQKVKPQTTQISKPTVQIGAVRSSGLGDLKRPISNDSVKMRDKKFKSLQAKLKHSELEREAVKKSSFGSLADFLQKLN